MVFVLVPKAEVGFVVLLVPPKPLKPVDVPAVEVLLPKIPPALVVVLPKAGLAPNGEDPWLVPKPVGEDALVSENSGLIGSVSLCTRLVSGGHLDTIFGDLRAKRQGQEKGEG